MRLDFSAVLYDPVYAELGVPATFDGTDIVVIDDTRPKTMASGSAEVRSVDPVAYARIPELISKGIARNDYRGSMVIFNGRNWIVRSYELRGSPNGEDLGEVRFLLKEAIAIVPPPIYPPVVTVAPVVVGEAEEGQTLTSDAGTWTGTAPVAYTYQWYRQINVGSGTTLYDESGQPLTDELGQELVT